jgi:hypothetical protein
MAMVPRVAVADPLDQAVHHANRLNARSCEGTDREACSGIGQWAGTLEGTGVVSPRFPNATAPEIQPGMRRGYHAGCASRHRTPPSACSCGNGHP